MKCPSCSHDHKYSAGMRCGRCAYAFVFNPKEGAMVADAGALALARVASGNHTQAFTPAQLQTAYMVKHGTKSPGCAAGAIWMVVVAIASFVTEMPVLLAPGLVIALITIYFGNKSPVEWDSPKSRAFLHGWARLMPMHQLPDAARFITPGDRQLTAPPSHGEADLFDYGIERVLVVDEPHVVDLLVANNVHADHRCAIVDKNAYPSFLQDAVVSALKARADIPVFLLHGTGGMTPPNWLPLDGRPVVELGLSRADLRTLKIFRRLAPAGTDSIPVDALPNGLLNGLLERSFATQTPFSEVIAAHGDADGGDFGASVIGDFG